MQILQDKVAAPMQDLGMSARVEEVSLFVDLKNSSACHTESTFSSNGSKMPQVHCIGIDNKRDLCLDPGPAKSFTPSCKKPPRPPRAPRPVTHSSGGQVTRCISDTRFAPNFGKAKSEKIISMSKKKQVESGCNATSFWALIVTICFAVIMVVQGMSHASRSLKNPTSEIIVRLYGAVDESPPVKKDVLNYSVQAVTHIGAQQKDEYVTEQLQQGKLPGNSQIIIMSRVFGPESRNSK